MFDWLFYKKDDAWAETTRHTIVPESELPPRIRKKIGKINFCPYCGTKVFTRDAKFCSSCGKSFNNQ